jgi:hypothetical protein
MTAYMQGETNLTHRYIPADHIEFIYQRAHEESPCRIYAADTAVSRLCDTNAQEQYQELCSEYPAFLKDIFASLGRVPSLLAAKDPAKMSRCAYHVHPSGERCPVAKEDARLGGGWTLKPATRAMPITAGLDRPMLDMGRFRHRTGISGPSQSGALFATSGSSIPSGPSRSGDGGLFGPPGQSN